MGHILTGELIARAKVKIGGESRGSRIKLVKITLQVNLDSEGCFTFDIAEIPEGARCIECGRLCKTGWTRLNMCRECEMDEGGKIIREAKIAGSGSTLTFLSGS